MGMNPALREGNVAVGGEIVIPLQRYPRRNSCRSNLAAGGSDLQSSCRCPVRNQWLSKSTQSICSRVNWTQGVLQFLWLVLWQVIPALCGNRGFKIMAGRFIPRVKFSSTAVWIYYLEIGAGSRCGDGSVCRFTKEVMAI